MTPTQIIEDKGGATAFAEKLRERPATVRMWKLRNRLPRSKWPEILEAFPDLTLDQLRATEAA